MHAPAEDYFRSVPYHQQQRQESDSRSGGLPNARIDLERGYQALANDPRYTHFVRIPQRILCCLDYFGVAGNRAETRARLHSYYLFIGVVDNAIDSGQVDTGARILECLSSRTPPLGEERAGSSTRLVTEILKAHISAASYSSMMYKFRRLYQEVVSERDARSIYAYIRHRKTVGRLTAELSYLLIRPLLTMDSQRLCRFMKTVGEVGCLVDSIIDLKADRGVGLLGFEPTMMDRGKLIVCTLQAGLRVLLKHPGLSGLFLQAIRDNLRDRFVRDQSPNALHVVADRKDEAASVV